MLAPVVLTACVLIMPAPLQRALEAARLHNHTLGISRAQLAQQDAQLRAAAAQLIPSVQASGGYTRNQYETVVSFPTGFSNGAPQTQTITINAYNALQATVGINVPLINATSITGYVGAEQGLQAAAAAEKASEADVLLSTARAYYQVVAAQGVVASAHSALTTAQSSLQVAEAKRQLGTANQLTVDRAKVDVFRAAQTVATGEQTLEVARRSLETLTGERFAEALPAPEEPTLPSAQEDTLVTQAQNRRAEVQQAVAALQQQETLLDQAWTGLAPSLVGAVQEHLTNAAGFVGHEAYWTAGVNLSWTLDPAGVSAAVSKGRATVLEYQHRLEQQKLAVRDDVHTVWLAVQADHARMQAAALEAQSAHSALALIQEQFKVGTATSLDISTAQRDAFSADASLSQSRADLAAELLALRRAAGDSLLEQAP